MDYVGFFDGGVVTSFASRPLQFWRSSIAETLPQISGVFAFELVPSLMVPQTLEFLVELRGRLPEVDSPTIRNFIQGMDFRSPQRPNQLLLWKTFLNAAELFAYRVELLVEAVRQLELHLDINLTFSRISYLAVAGAEPFPVLVIERRPFFRGVGFEIEQRANAAKSLIKDDLVLSYKARAAQQHYSTGLTLLAGEDQIAGLLDAAFMQFYLAIECVLDNHAVDAAVKNGIAVFGANFDAGLQKAVRHVYSARHRFFGHGHPKEQRAQSDSEMAFSIAKQTLVARWCARKLISLEIGTDLVQGESRLYRGIGGSVQFTGPSQLDSEFSLPK